MTLGRWLEPMHRGGTTLLTHWLDGGKEGAMEEEGRVEEVSSAGTGRECVPGKVWAIFGKKGQQGGWSQ